MHIGAEHIRVHTVAILINTETETTANFLAFTHFTGALLQSTNLEYVRVIPTFA